MKILGSRLFFAALLIALFLSHAKGQKRDPLNPAEIDQLRDAAQDPDTRLHLYIKFAEQRLIAADQARTDPKVTDHSQAVHDHLQDFEDLYDELNDNIDSFADQRQDIRHALKAVLDADAQFLAKLRALVERAPKDSTQDYQFVLSDAIDDVDSSTKDHTQLLAEQEDAAKHKRLIKPQPPSRAKLPPE